MNKNFKYSLIAFMAVLSSVAMGNCHGMQTSSDGDDGAESEVIQASEASHFGAFGGVKSATKIHAEEPEPAFPPIVTAAHANTPPIAKLQEDTPPILIPKHFDPSIVASQENRSSPPIVQSGSSQSNPPIVRSVSKSGSSNPPIVRSVPPISQPSDSISQQNNLNRPLPPINRPLPPINQAMPPISRSTPAISQQTPKISQPNGSTARWTPPVRQLNQANNFSKSTIAPANPPIVQSSRPRPAIVRADRPSNSNHGKSTPSIVTMAPPIVPSIPANNPMNRYQGQSDRTSESTLNSGYYGYANSAPDVQPQGMPTFTPKFDQPFPASPQVIPGIDPVASMAVQKDSRAKKSVMLAPIQTSERTQDLASPLPVNQIPPQQNNPMAPMPMNQIAISSMNRQTAAPMNQMAARPADQVPIRSMNQMAASPVNQMPANIPVGAPSISSMAEPTPNPLAAPVIQATNAPSKFQRNQDVLQAAQWGQSDNLARGVSAAGIPLYPGVGSKGGSPELVENVDPPSMIENHATVDPVVPPAPSISSNSRYVSPIDSMSPPTPIPATARPAQLNSSNVLPAKSRTLTPNNAPRQDYFQQQPMEAPVMAGPGCSICGTQLPGNGASCPICSNTPACESCGGRGCHDCGIAGTPGNQTAGCPTCGAGGCYNPNAVAEQFGDCGSVAQARGYLVAEGLYLNRRDGVIANSNFGALSNFEWAGGLHLTVGRRRDSISGREISYFGTDEMSEDVRHTDAAGRIRARFIAADGFLPSEISAFRNAVEQVESKQTELHSLEFNRVEWGWDVVKTYVGLRGLYIEDSYQMASRNIFAEEGLFEVYVKDYLIGPNWGTEIYYDVGSRLSATMIVRGGLYGSISQVRTKLNNNGSQILNVEDDNSTIGGTLEFGVNGRFRIAKRANLRFGYNLLLVSRVAEASNNVPATITPTIGSATSNTNDMQFHGANIGFEIYR